MAFPRKIIPLSYYNLLCEILGPVAVKQMLDEGRIKLRPLHSAQVSVLYLLVGGYKQADISKFLFIHRKTVRSHLRIIRETLGIHTNEEIMNLIAHPLYWHGLQALNIIPDKQQHFAAVA